MWLCLLAVCPLGHIMQLKNSWGLAYNIRFLPLLSIWGLNLLLARVGVFRKWSNNTNTILPIYIEACYTVCNIAIIVHEGSFQALEWDHLAFLCTALIPTRAQNPVNYGRDLAACLAMTSSCCFWAVWLSKSSPELCLSTSKHNNMPTRQWPKVYDLCHTFCTQKPTDMQEMHTIFVQFLHVCGVLYLLNMLQNLTPLATA